MSELKKLKKYFSEQGKWVLFGRIILTGIGLLSSILMARILTTQEYGEYKFVLSIIALLAIFSLPESFQVVIRYIPRGFNEILDYLLKLRLKISIISGAASLGVGAYYFTSDKLSLAIIFFCISFILPAYYSYQLYEPYMLSLNKNKIQNTTAIIKSLLQILSFFAVYYLTKSSPASTIIMILCMASVNIIFYNYIKNTDKINLPTQEKNQADIKAVKNETFILSAAGILPIISEQADKILIGDKISFESLAIYSTGILFAQAINGFFKPFISSISSKLVHKKIDTKYFSAILITGTLIGVSLSLASQYIFPFLYGEKYSSGIIYTKIVLSSMGLYLLNTIYYNQNLFYKNNSIKNIYINNTIIPILNLIYAICIIHFVKNESEILIFLTFAYPLKLVISTLMLFFLSKISYRLK